MRLNRLGARWILLSASGLSLVLAATVRLPADTRVESQSHLLKDIKYLASDELEGRGIGTDGLNKAADYIREQFKDAGLDVTRVKGDAFQKFKMTTKAILGSPNSVKFVGPDGKVVELKQNVDFVPASFGGGGKFSGDVVFAGYGLDDPDYKDFKGVDVKGKVVIVMRRNPRQEEEPDASAGGPGPGRRPGRRGAGRFGDLLETEQCDRGRRQWHHLRERSVQRAKGREGSRISVRRSNNHVVEAAEALDTAETKAAADAKAQAAAGAGKTGPTSPAVTEALKDLREEVTKLKKAKAEIKKPENDVFMKFGYGGNGKDGSIPVVQLKVAAATACSSRRSAKRSQNWKRPSIRT